MEVRMALHNSTLNIEPKDLLQISRNAEINKSGWPIGLVAYNNDLKPKPSNDGISTQIISNPHYDYWAIKKDGSFYLLRNLWECEDQIAPNQLIMFDLRIWQITEVLLYCSRLYSGLGALPDDTIFIRIKHGGLRGFNLDSSEHQYFTRVNPSQEDETFEEFELLISQIHQDNIVSLVEKFTRPLFALFDFFEIPRKNLENIVTKFLEGRA
jgi:hypothetical protein